MIKPIVNYLNNQLGELFSGKYGLGELVTVGGNTYPMLYGSNGSYYSLSNISQFIGLSYFRKNGEVSFSDVEGFTACASDQEVKIPLKFVVSIQRGILLEDNNYHDDNLALYIIKLFTAKNPLFKREINAKTLKIQAGDYETRKSEVLSEEYGGNEAIQINTAYSYISIDLVVTLVISSSCIADLCGDILITNVPEDIETNNEINIEVNG